MEPVALIILILGFVAISIHLTDDDLKNSQRITRIMITFICIIIGQIFWFPIYMDPKVETETYITTKYENIEFDQPVKIFITKFSKPLSVVYSEKPIIKIEILKEE